MKSEHDQISLQGIEFWSTVCDEEADLSIEAVEVYTRTHVPTVRTVYVYNVLKMGTCTCTCTLCTYIHVLCGVKALSHYVSVVCVNICIIHCT